MHGVVRVSDCHQTVFVNSPTSIDLCPSAGHGCPGKTGSNVLSGICTDQAGEFLVEIYIPAGQGRNSQFGGVLWAALEYQTVVEIDNHGTDAQTIRPTITRLVN